MKANGVSVERIDTDKATGANSDRLGLIAVLKALWGGDTLVVVKLDRLDRPIKRLIELRKAIQAKEAVLRVLDAGIGMGTPVGRFTFHVVGALAEFELTLIRARRLACGPHRSKCRDERYFVNLERGLRRLLRRKKEHCVDPRR